ncbi:hypothetical protein NDU88_004259 [Pleurodeles waltl]|uniref:Uncharacterized protein n=1 Tax=Pleurodeles waltl TaxID=8319 RepID=A0AAV7TQS6_PLEWA|nr:hypothetical protein NDU88_004259 [Pleurodeles waltl]
MADSTRWPRFKQINQQMVNKRTQLAARYLSFRRRSAPAPPDARCERGPGSRSAAGAGAEGRASSWCPGSVCFSVLGSPTSPLPARRVPPPDPRTPSSPQSPIQSALCLWLRSMSPAPAPAPFPCQTLCSCLWVSEWQVGSSTPPSPGWRHSLRDRQAGRRAGLLYKSQRNPQCGNCLRNQSPEASGCCPSSAPCRPHRCSC